MKFIDYLGSFSVKNGTDYDRMRVNSESVVGLFGKLTCSVRPTLVEICGNDDLKGKKIYYSPVPFRKVNKTGRLGTIIVPCDNTGYRSCPDTYVQIFETYQECVDYFKSQVSGMVNDLEGCKVRELFMIDGKIKELGELLAEYGETN